MRELAPLVGPVTLSPERFSAQALWKLLRPRLWLVALFAIAGSTAAFGISTRLPKLYTASGAIAVGGQSFTIPELQGALRANDNDPMLLVRTEEQALSARQLIEKVVVQLRLAERKEFNPALNSPGLLAQASVLLKHLLPAETPPPYSVPDNGLVSVVAAVSKAMTVFNDNRSLVITIGFTSTDPVLSATFINTLISDYQAERARQRNMADEAAKRTLGEQVSQIDAEIDRLEQQVSDLRDQGRLVTLRGGSSVGQEELETLAAQAVQARTARTQLEATLQRVSALAANGAAADYSGALTSETIVRLRDQEAVATRRLADMTMRFGPDYPALRDAQASVAAVRALVKQEDARIVGSLSAQLDVAKQHEADAQTQLDVVRDEAVKIESLQSHVDALQRQISDRRALVQQLQQRSQQTIAPASSQVLDVRELIQAEPPPSPSSPKKGLAGALGGLAGGMFGLLLVIGRIRQPASGPVSFTTGGLPVFASLPSRSGTRSNLLTLVQNYPVGEEAEALRMLRTRIRVCAHAVAPRVVAFISGQDGQEGARIAAAFASVAAADGERTLLIETDLQAPSLAALLGSTHGELPAVLRGDLLWRDAIVCDARNGLDMLLACEASATAHAMLSSVRFQSLLAEASNDYNLVVLSGPSLRMRAGALTVAHRADASVLIINSRSANEATLSSFAADLTRVSFGPASALLLRPR